MAALWLDPLPRSKAKKTGGCLPETLLRCRLCQASIELLVKTTGSKVDLQTSSVCTVRSNDLSRSASKGKVGKPGSAGWSHELAISSSKQYALMATCWPSLASFGPTHPHSLVVH
uniref:Uncharacterized protein n=1 Tax=Vespula pensylvanica TaxID=30213 RepID=A0A834UGL8_VESPE|nr:hypothetical protein H0235_000981 [Vespula pensylvanica]